MSSTWELPGEVRGAQVVYDFLSVAEEAQLLSKVDNIGGTDPSHPKAGGWVSLNGRRSMYWGGIVTKTGALIPSALPDFMSTQWPSVHPKIAATGAYDHFGDEGGVPVGPNHVLVNEYLPGQRIEFHTDGPAYSPLVSTVSLNGHTIIKLKPPHTHTQQPATPPISILLPPRSLFLLSSKLYSEYLHGIEPVELDSPSALRACANWDSYWTAKREGGEERERERERMERDGWARRRRVSLTCRRVSKVLKGFKLG